MNVIQTFKQTVVCLTPFYKNHHTVKMNPDLLLKEQQYYDINKKLEQRTRQLLEKVDEIKISRKDDLFTLPNAPNRSKSVPTIQHESGAAFTEDELKSLNLTEDINHVGAKGFTHFLKAKVKQLQFDFEKLQHEHKSKCDELKKLQKDNDKLHEDKEKFMYQANVSRTQINKLDNQVSFVQSKLQAKESENIVLKRDIETLSRDLRMSKGDAKSNELKHQRALDELNQLKTSLRTLRQDDKDFKDTHKKHSQTLNETIKRLEKQKTDLLHGFKKQYTLVENLKKQKAQIEVLKLTDKVEADFIKLVKSDFTD